METITFNIGTDTIILVSEILKNNLLPHDGVAVGEQIKQALQNLMSEAEE